VVGSQTPAQQGRAAGFAGARKDRLHSRHRRIVGTCFTRPTSRPLLLPVRSPRAKGVRQKRGLLKNHERSELGNLAGLKPIHSLPAGQPVCSGDIELDAAHGRSPDRRFQRANWRNCLSIRAGRG